MPSFFSDLRRRSNASFKGDLNADSASSGTGSNESTNDLQPNRRSFNSLTSHFKSAIYEGGYGRKKSDGSLSGPSLHSGQRTPPVSNDKRPSLNTGPGSRYSIAVSPATKKKTARRLIRRKGLPCALSGRTLGSIYITTRS